MKAAGDARDEGPRRTRMRPLVDRDGKIIYQRPEPTAGTDELQEVGKFMTVISSRPPPLGDR